MYPIIFENVYKRKIWGGRDLEYFRNNLPSGDLLTKNSLFGL